MNYEYSCDKSAISLVNTALCRPLSPDAGRRRTSKCCSNRTKFNINDSDDAFTHDVVYAMWTASNKQCVQLASSSDVVRRRTTSWRCERAFSVDYAVARYRLSVHPSVRPPVCLNVSHTPVFYLNGYMYILNVSSPSDSPAILVF